MQAYNKLIRDRIPDIIRESGKNPVTRVLASDEFLAALEQKLAEEVEELRTASIPQHKKEELADIHEVLDALMREFAFSREEVLLVQEEKRNKRGEFQLKLFLEYVE